MAKKIKKIFSAFIAPKIIILYGICLFSFCLFVFSAGPALASHNVIGWAWSETLGWISFNCANQDSCSSVDYGVDIDNSSGNFSGYAWSEIAGWIKLDPPKDLATNQYPSAPQQAAKLDGNLVKGWARACIGTVNNDCNSLTAPGWDGWIKMDGPTYGVTSSGCLLSDYAWAGDAGWIKFRGTTLNGMEYGVSDAACSNPPPLANGLSLSLNFCAPAPAVSFTWAYSDPFGENEKKFELQIDDNNDFSSPAIDRIFDNLGWPSPVGNSQSVLLTSAVEADKLTYDGRTYYWRVKVWDASDNFSLWVAGSSSFALPLHAYPAVNFVWAQLSPGVNEETQFLDESQIFGGASLSVRLWTFPSIAYLTDKTTFDLDPKAKFTVCGDQPVSLKIDDSNGYSCTLDQIVHVKTAHCWAP